jgi:hypothetical protein
MSSQPPAFENVANCRKCNTSFGMITRKHHCRNCGRTFCQNCSSKNTPLPHYNITESVRVCDACYSDVQAAIMKASRPNTNTSTTNNSTATPSATTTTTTNTTPVSGNLPRRQPVPTTSGPTTFSGFGGASKKNAYDMSGNLNEQCRDAIKSGDLQGFRDLLQAGAEATYKDHTGNSLVHLAAMFNRYEMIVDLAKRGADLTEKNPDGESPFDLAPPALAHKMKSITA